MRLAADVGELGAPRYARFVTWVLWIVALVLIGVGTCLLLFADRYIAWRTRLSAKEELPLSEPLVQAIGGSLAALGLLTVLVALARS